MRAVLTGLWVVLLLGCDASPGPLAQREAPPEETLAPAGPTSVASTCTSAVKPPSLSNATQRVKVRGYTADNASVRFFLEPKGNGKAPFEVAASSQNLQNLLLSAFDAQREVEVALNQNACVPEVVFIRSP